MDLLLHGPGQMLGTATEAEYEARQRRFAVSQRLVLQDRNESITAYVNGGRWVADCPSCGAGIAVAPTWRARCYGCGAVYNAPTFPDDSEAIESVLLCRLMKHRNMVAGETAIALAVENLDHGVDVPPYLIDEANAAKAELDARRVIIAAPVLIVPIGVA